MYGVAFFLFKEFKEFKECLFPFIPLFEHVEGKFLFALV